MKTEELEDGDVCPYCGVLAIFFEGAADISCPNCGSELINIGLDDNVDGNNLDEIDPDEVESDGDTENSGPSDGAGDSFGGADEGDY